jgi:flagellar protein FliS
MNELSAASAYRESVIENAPPIKVVHFMYEGALRLVTLARTFDPETQFREYNDSLKRAGAIVSELRLALEPEHAPELAVQLTSLYRFVEQQIREAFLERTPEPLESVESVLQTLLDGWRQVEMDMKRTPA